MKDQPEFHEHGVVPSLTPTDVSDAGSVLTWSVGAVSARLDVAPSTLRTWERRYGIGPSHRTRGGHRRYTEDDIEKVELVRRLVERGVSAQDAARVARSLEHDDLVSALSEESERDTRGIDAEDLIDAVLAAAMSSDGRRLHELIGNLLDGSGFIDVWRDVLSPTLARMARERSAGTLEEGAERVATEVFLHEMRGVRSRGVRAASPQVLLASAVPEENSLPMTALAAALVDAGITIHTVGPETDARAVPDLVDKLRPQVLLWWEQPAVAEESLRHLMERSDLDTSLLRLSPAWPYELGLRFGLEPPMVLADVDVALGHVLDRVT